ncbi:T-cell acute lymphocytic leukemia protein 1 isoform X5 [Pelodiscus sinensis]|uniref:T-cell acute lymphocytic leukemia protein 1 isoform X5 n=1 Tax=Pelodiscus sinensis TaxID=13735 RepID=UPI003F6C3199
MMSWPHGFYISISASVQPRDHAYFPTEGIAHAVTCLTVPLRTMERPPAELPPSEARDARPPQQHDSGAEGTSEPESSRGGMEVPGEPQLLLNGVSKETGRPSPGPPAAAVPVIELVRRDIKGREAPGEAMQRAPGAEPCRPPADAACDARMVQLSPTALPLPAAGRAMLYNIGQPLAAINSGFFGEPDAFSMYNNNRMKRRSSPYEVEISDVQLQDKSCIKLIGPGGEEAVRSDVLPGCAWGKLRSCSSFMNGGMANEGGGSGRNPSYRERCLETFLIDLPEDVVKNRNLTGFKKELDRFMKDKSINGY